MQPEAIDAKGGMTGICAACSAEGGFAQAADGQINIFFVTASVQTSAKRVNASGVVSGKYDETRENPRCIIRTLWHDLSPSVYRACRATELTASSLS